MERVLRGKLGVTLSFPRWVEELGQQAWRSKQTDRVAVSGLPDGKDV